MMDSLTENEMGQILRLERDGGLRRLSSHFSWPEYFDERLSFHQEFVYDAVMFAADRGFSCRNVILAGGVAHSIFPKLGDLDVLQLASLLRDVLCQYLPNLPPFHQREFAHYLVDTLVTRRRLFQAVVRGECDVIQLSFEVEVPPTPCPLAQGKGLDEPESQPTTN